MDGLGAVHPLCVAQYTGPVIVCVGIVWVDANVRIVNLTFSHDYRQAQMDICGKNKTLIVIGRDILSFSSLSLPLYLLID